MAAVKVSGTGNFLFPKDVGPGTGVFVWIIFLSLILAVLFLLDILTTQLILGMGGVEAQSGNGRSGHYTTSSYYP